MKRRQVANRKRNKKRAGEIANKIEKEKQDGGWKEMKKFSLDENIFVLFCLALPNLCGDISFASTLQL